MKGTKILDTSPNVNANKEKTTTLLAQRFGMISSIIQDVTSKFEASTD